MAKKNSNDNFNDYMHGTGNGGSSDSSSVPPINKKILQDIQERAPFFSTFVHSSYISQSQMDYTPRTTISAFSNVSRPSYISKPLLKDVSDRALYETFLSPFMYRENTGNNLQKKTIQMNKSWLDLPSKPDYRSIHDVDYYKNRFKSLSTAKTISAYDTETMGENIWQIGYAYGTKGLDTDLNNSDELLSGNTILLPSQEYLSELREIADSDYATLTPKQQVIYKTLSNMGSDDTVFNRVVDNQGYANYQMESYADADISKENAMRGYDKLRSITEQSVNDKKFEFDGHKLRSDQKQFLDVIGDRIYNADIIYGHNTERFDMPKLIHNVSMITGGWDYLKKYYGITSDSMIDDRSLDMNDAIRALSADSRLQLQDALYGYNSPILSEQGRTPFQLASLEDALDLRDAYEEYRGEGKGVSHAADFDAKMSFALLKDSSFMGRLNYILQIKEISNDNNVDSVLSAGDYFHFDKGSFGYINPDNIRLVKEDANGNILFDTGYGRHNEEISNNGFEKDFHVINGASIPKDTTWQVQDMEWTDMANMSADKAKILRKVAPQLADDKLLHLSLSGENGDIIHLFGTQKIVETALSHMGHVTTDNNGIDNEKRALDRARRTVEQSSVFTQDKIDDLYKVVSDTFDSVNEISADDTVSRKKIANILMQQASAVSYGVASGKQLTIEQQKKLGITNEQFGIITSKAKEVAKWFDFGKDRDGFRQVASLGYLQNLATITGAMPQDYFEYTNNLIHPIMSHVDEILDQRFKNGEFTDNVSDETTKIPFAKNRKKEIRKQISGIVHQQIADEIARRHPELGLIRDDNKYLLDTTMQGDSSRINKRVIVDLSKDSAHYSLIKQITNFYDLDPDMLESSPSRQFDTMVRFIEESNDPALASIREDIERKSGKGLKGKKLERYQEVQNIINADNLNPDRLSSLMIERIKEYRDKNPDAGAYTRNNVDLVLAKEHPELFTELMRDEKFKTTLLANAEDAATNTAGNTEAFVNAIMDNTVQSKESIQAEINRMYGKDSRQAKHLYSLYETVRTEYENNVRQFIQASYGTQLKFDRTTGQFMLYDSSGKNGADISKLIPRIEMHGGTLAARLGDTSYALNMGFDYIGRDSLNSDFTLRSNLGRAFDTAYPVKFRKRTSDIFDSSLGYLRDVSKRFRNDGAVYIQEGNLQDAKYNFSLDFSHSYKGLVALSNEQSFLNTLSQEDADEFRKQFYSKYNDLKDPTNFLNKLDEGNLDAQQRNIINRILPDLNRYMIKSHDINSNGTDSTVREAQTKLWDDYMSQLYFDYKNHMVSEGIVLTDELAVGGEGFTRLSRDIQNQTTRATIFEKKAAQQIAHRLGIYDDVTLGNAIMTQAGDSWFNSRIMNDTEYTATMQAPVFVGDNAAFKNRVSSFVDKIDNSTQGIIDKATGKPINELADYSVEQIKKASQQLIDKTNVSEGGAVLDARLVDITGIQNDMNPIKLKDDLRIVGFEDIKNIKNVQDASKLIPILEKDEDGNLHMRYVPGKYYETGSRVFKRVNGYAGSEQTIRQKENGIVKAGIFNAANKLVDAETVTKDVYTAAKRAGVEIKSSSDFYNILHTALKGKYYEAFYNDKVNGQGAVKMVRDMSEKAETTQIYGHIGSVYSEVTDTLRKLGLGGLPEDISYNVFKDLTNKNFVYNDYLASLINRHIKEYNKGKKKKDKISFVDTKNQTRYDGIYNVSDWEAWVSSHIGHKEFYALSDKLTNERYLMSRILHSATGGYGVDMDAFIHHNGVWQPVNQLVSDMIAYSRKNGKTVKEANEAVYRALQPGAAEDSVFLLLDKDGNPFKGALTLDKNTKRILLPDNADYNINVRNLQLASERIYGKENGRKRFTEIMGGYSDADNDQEGIGIRDVEGRQTPLVSSKAGYTATTSLSFIHDNTRNGYLGGMNSEDVYDKVNKAGNVSDRELAKLSLIRRSEDSISKAQQLWKDLGRDDTSFRDIYGISANDDTKLAAHLNESIENPYIKEIRSNQFMSPEQIIRSHAKENGDVVPVSKLSSEQYDALSDRERAVINTLTNEGYSEDKISLHSVKELAHGIYGSRAVMANQENGISESSRETLVQDYGFKERNIGDINNVHTKQLVQGKSANIFNTNMIVNMEDNSLGITKDVLNKYNGVSSVAIAAISPHAFGSQEITTDINDAFDRLQNYRGRIAALQKKSGATPSGREAHEELQRLYRNYALATHDIVAAQQRVATGDISTLKNFMHVGMAYSIRPKVGVATEESFYDRDWAKTAKIDGALISEYTTKGKVAPDVVRISPKQAREMGLITADYGTDLYKAQLRDLSENGVMAHTNRSPTNYAGSDVATRIYVGTDVQNGQVQMSHYLAVKMKADTDGDAARHTADQFVYKQNVLMESQVRMLNKVKHDQQKFNALVESYGFHNISTDDLDVINTQWSKLARAHRESEIYQQTIVNPSLRKAEKTFDALTANTNSNILSDSEMNSFRNEFAEQIIPDRLIGKNQDVLLGKSNIPMISSGEASKIRHDYKLLQSEFRNKNKIDKEADLTGEQQKQFMRWAGQDSSRFNVVSSYNNLQENTRNILGKTRQAAAGIVDLPVYRMARMTQMAKDYLPKNEATELQNLFTVMQEGFLSPKNSNARDWNAVSDLIDITGRMGKIRNGTVDQSAFDDLADWVRSNAAKAPNVKMIDTPKGPKLDVEHYAKIAQEKLPELFKKMPHFFDDMSAMDMVFLSRKGVNINTLRQGLEAAAHSDVAGNNMSARLLNIIGNNLSEKDRQQYHLKDTADIVMPNVQRRKPKMQAYDLDEALRSSNRHSYESALQKASRVVNHAGGSKKVIAGIIGGLGFAGYMGGNPSEDPDAERKMQQQKRPINAQPMPEFSDTSVMAQRGLSSASGGYMININAQTKKGHDFAQQVINQATSNTFNQMDVNITTHVRQDTPTASPDMIADYVQEALTN